MSRRYRLALQRSTVPPTRRQRKRLVAATAIDRHLLDSFSPIRTNQGRTIRPICLCVCLCAYVCVNINGQHQLSSSCSLRGRPTERPAGWPPLSPVSHQTWRLPVSTANVFPYRENLSEGLRAKQDQIIYTPRLRPLYSSPPSSKRRLIDVGTDGSVPAATVDSY